MPFSTSLLMPRPTDTMKSAPIRSTSFFAAFTVSVTSVLMSLAASSNAGCRISTFFLHSRFFITPGRTVAIAGRKRGQMMEAIRWPPKAGRVIFRSRSTGCGSRLIITVPSFSMRSSGSVEASFRKPL